MVRYWQKRAAETSWYWISPAPSVLTVDLLSKAGMYFSNRTGPFKISQGWFKGFFPVFFWSQQISDAWVKSIISRICKMEYLSLPPLRFMLSNSSLSPLRRADHGLRDHSLYQQNNAFKASTQTFFTVRKPNWGVWPILDPKTLRLQKVSLPLSRGFYCISIHSIACLHILIFPLHQYKLHSHVWALGKHSFHACTRVLSL